jgi:hypothetical protein
LLSFGWFVGIVWSSSVSVCLRLIRSWVEPDRGPWDRRYRRYAPLISSAITVTDSSIESAHWARRQAAVRDQFPPFGRGVTEFAHVGGHVVEETRDPLVDRLRGVQLEIGAHPSMVPDNRSIGRVPAGVGSL